MRAVVQRVKEASVMIDGNDISDIKKGFLVYLGIHVDDTMDHVQKMAQKIHALRVFEDEAGKMSSHSMVIRKEIIDHHLSQQQDLNMPILYMKLFVML